MRDYSASGMIQSEPLHTRLVAFSLRFMALLYRPRSIFNFFIFFNFINFIELSKSFLFVIVFFCMVFCYNFIEFCLLNIHVLLVISFRHRSASIILIINHPIAIASTVEEHGK